MKKFKKFNSFLSVYLILSVVLGNFSLPVLAYGKNDVNFEQVRTETMLDNSRDTFNKIKPLYKEIQSLSSDSLIIKKEKIDLKAFQQIKGNKNYVEGEVLVKYKENKINLKTSLGRVAAENFNRAKSLEKKEDLRKINTSVLKIKDNKTVEQKIIELKNDSNVEYAEPNYIRQWTSITPNDTDFSKLWGLHNTTKDADIDAPEAWDIFTGSNSVVVAVLDSGIAYNHPDLINNMWDGTVCKNENDQSISCPNHGWDYTNSDNDPIDDNGHGTHVAGTIGAEGNNNIGVIGVNWDVEIMALKVGNYAGAVTGDVVKAIDFAINNGVKIINASFNGSGDSQAEFDAINRFKQAGGIFIAAAGNGGVDQVGDNNDIAPQYPADYALDNIISVAATDQNDNLASFSNYGINSVDVGAPGVNIYSIVADSVVLNETFEGVVPPNIPSGWAKTDYWGTYNTGVNGWDNVLYGDAYNIPYAGTANSVITSPSYNLSNANEAKIDFWTVCDTEYDTENWTDYMSLEISNDGLNFTELGSWDEALLDFYNSDPFDDSGSSVYHFQDIFISSQYLTNAFKLRFRWVANGNTDTGGGDGCLVDDVKITKYSDGSDGKYGYMDGTSMAAPHVAGLTALIWGYRPDLTYSEVKNTILNTGDSLFSLDGKTVTGKRINAFNALQSLTQENHTISGTVSYYDGVKVIPDADVILEDDQGTQLMVATTDENGYYEFTGLTSGDDYVVRVESNDQAATNGTDIFDLITLRRHIAEIERLDSIFKKIAADVDSDLDTDIFDLINLRRYIAEIAALPSGAWKFYSSGVELTVENYLSDGLTRNYTNLIADSPNQDFTGVKMGDINNSWEI